MENEPVTVMPAEAPEPVEAPVDTNVTFDVPEGMELEITQMYGECMRIELYLRKPKKRLAVLKKLFPWMKTRMGRFKIATKILILQNASDPHSALQKSIDDCVERYEITLQQEANKKALEQQLQEYTGRYKNGRKV
jgi:hypothetical protein